VGAGVDSWSAGAPCSGRGGTRSTTSQPRMLALRVWVLRCRSRRKASYSAGVFFTYA